ncbi:MAG: hypothetical protein IPP69_14520 [Flavobacteriales bacterium]|nr:hypothetical protein [Flavobacteriales bacterium]
MNGYKFYVLGLMCLFSGMKAVYAQSNKELKHYLGKDSTEFVKLTFVNQTWVRQTQNNPGSTLNGVATDKSFDIGLRRTRLQLYGKTSKHTFFYLQLGQNNFNGLSARKSGFFIHDALGEIDVNKHFAMGAGLTAWTGFSRFSSPSVASIMALDAPLFLQATNDANDQFLRKLSVYAKGKISKLDYRLIVSRPMAITTFVVYNASNPLGSDAQFSPLPPKPQYSGYLSWQFFDQESNELPYQTGTYLGKKHVLNLGAGAQFQQNAMWYNQMLDSVAVDTLHHDMLLAAVDVFYDAPLRREKGDAISFYAVAAYYDFGKNYIRNQGPMNVTDGMNVNGTFSGTGVAWPMIGTGTSFYAQLGYLSPELSATKKLGKLMPYVSAQWSKYDLAKDLVLYGDAGCSWYLDGTRSKLTFGVQNRPVMKLVTPSDGPHFIQQQSRKNSFILQYQVSI